MKRIKIYKGLNVPIKGNISNFSIKEIDIKEIAEDFTPYFQFRLKPSVKEGDSISVGSPIAFDPRNKKRIFTSNSSGRVSKIVRGEKRKLNKILIEKDVKESFHENRKLDSSADRSEVLSFLAEEGLLSLIEKRPFPIAASPLEEPRDIFISAIDKKPLSFSPMYEVLGLEEIFQYGITQLSKIAPVHLVFQEEFFANFKNAFLYKGFGPDPIGNHSVHIEAIAPIKKESETVWTLKVQDVIDIGHKALLGKKNTKRVIGLSGEGIKEEDRRLFRVPIGASISSLLVNRVKEGPLRIVGGNVLMGEENPLYLGVHNRVISAIPEQNSKEFLHFFRVGWKKYSSSFAYLSGLISRVSGKAFSFSSSKLGEETPIVDGRYYDRVNPLSISIEALFKALIAKDFEEALRCGLLEISYEDFALAEFVCPSKISLTALVKKRMEEFREMYFA